MIERIDLDSEALDLGGLPRLLQATSHLRQLSWLGMLFGIAAMCLWSAAYFLSESVWRTLSLNLGSFAALTAIALLAARRVALWRAKAMRAALSAPIEVAQDDGPRRWKWIAAAFYKTKKAFRRVARRIGGDIGIAMTIGAVAALALFLIKNGWTWRLSPSDLGLPGPLVAAAALLLAFGVLVVERHLTARAAAEWPESLRLAQYLRAVIALLAIVALILFFASERNTWPLRLIVAIGIVTVILAVELLLRAVLALFQPRNDRVEPAFLADCLSISMLRWPPRPLQLLHNELHSRFGIDLRQSWAFAFMRRAALPVFGAIALLGWLLTGVYEIPVDGRGIYERFGRPIAVWQPGLHAGLPWPFGRIRAVELGAVHELAATLTAETSVDVAPDSVSVEINDAEGLPPRSANRLWDASHIAEKSQVIASESGGRQNFQIVNMDVRFIYRVAADDAAALSATYNSADLLSLMRSSANRLLVQYFASRTLDGVLGAARAEMAKDIGAAVQADLDALRTGVEILATMVESIHPPAGAANSYHAVQAAQIHGQAAIARERGRAAEETNAAGMRAAALADRATAAARETHAAAEAVRLRFAAEREAHRVAGRAFVTELYLAQLTSGLADAKLVVLDHRIAGGAATVDLRRFSGAAPLDTKD